MEYASFLNLVPAAAIITALTYLTTFFGKVMEDQNPVVDDRKWSIELAGLMFMMSVGLGGFIGIMLAKSWSWGLDTNWLHFVMVVVFALLSASQYAHNFFEGSRVFNINSKKIKDIEKKNGEWLKKYGAISGHLGINVLSIILFYFGTLEFLSKDVYWISFTCLATFFILIFAALNFSYKRLKGLVLVEIHFADKTQETILNARILKKNDDNIRLRADNKIIIVNKSLVSRIEMPIPPETL